MAKIIHTGDWQFSNSLPHGTIDPKTGLNTRFLDQLEAFDFMVNWAKDNGVTAVLVVGDLYERYNAIARVRREVCSRLGKLLTAGIHVFILAGNHDTDGLCSALDDIHLLGVQTVLHVDVSEALVETDELHAGGLGLGCFKWVANIPWAVSPDGGFDLVAVREWLSTLRDGLEGEAVVPDEPGIVLAHIPIFGAWETLGHQCPLGILPSELPQRDNIYTALGHFHVFQEIIDGHAYYSGSPIPVKVDEAGQPKGFLVIEADDVKPDWEMDFVAIPSRPILRVQGDSERFAPDSLDEYIMGVGQEVWAKGPIVEVKIECQPGEFFEAGPVKLALRRAGASKAIVRVTSKAVTVDEAVRQSIQGASLNDQLCVYIRESGLEPQEELTQFCLGILEGVTSIEETEPGALEG